MSRPYRQTILITGASSGLGKGRFDANLQTAQTTYAAIEREPAKACVPAWPWSLIAIFIRHAPLAWVARMA